MQIEEDEATVMQAFAATTKSETATTAVEGESLVKSDAAATAIKSDPEPPPPLPEEEDDLATVSADRLREIVQEWATKRALQAKNTAYAAILKRRARNLERQVLRLGVCALSASSHEGARRARLCARALSRSTPR